MDLKKATAEYEVQMRNAIHAHKKCQDMARREEAIEKEIKHYTQEVEQRMALIRRAEAELARSKARHQEVLEELQKTVLLPLQSSSQVKQEQQASEALSQVDAKSCTPAGSRKRDYGLFLAEYEISD